MAFQPSQIQQRTRQPRATRVPFITPEEWEEHRAAISSWYMEQHLTNDQVRVLLDDLYNFKPSHAQLAKQVITWGMRKNASASFTKPANATHDTVGSSSTQPLVFDSDLDDMEGMSAPRESADQRLTTDFPEFGTFPEEDRERLTFAFRPRHQEREESVDQQAGEHVANDSFAVDLATLEEENPGSSNEECPRLPTPSSDIEKGCLLGDPDGNKAVVHF